MSFSLRNLVKHVANDVNPFDGPSQPAATPPPASTARPQQNVAQRAFNQVNPFDGGRTFKQTTPTNNRSVLGQATHNAVTNVVGSAVKFVPQFSENYSNTFANLGNRLAGAPNQTIQQNMGGNPFLDNTLKLSGATGTNKQLAGDAAQIGLSTIPAVGKGASFITKLGAGAATGAGFGGASTFGEGGSLKDIAKSAAIGGALGAAAPVAPKLIEAAPKVADAGKAVIAHTTNLVSPKFAGLTKDQVIMAPAKLDVLKDALNPGSQSDVNLRQEIINGLHQIKNDHGHDFISGSPADRKQRISQFLEQNGEAIPEYQKWMAKPRFANNEVGGAKAGDILPDRVFGADQPATPIGDALATNPAQLTSNAPRVTTKLVPAQPMMEAPVNAASLPDNTSVDVNQHLKQQINAQDAARKADSPQGLGKVSAASSQLKKNLVDSLAPIEDTLHQKVNAQNAAHHITPQLDRVLRADTIGSQYIKDNGLAKIIQSAPSTKELDQYLIAKHAPAYEAEHGAGASGRNLSADAKLVKQLAPKYEAHAKAVTAYSQKVLDDAVGYGLISKEAATSLKAKYPDYVPLNRIFGENELQSFKGNGGGKASISTQGVVKAGKGSQRAIESPLSSLVDKSMQLVKDGERNKAAQILTGYKDLPGNPFGLRELAKGETVGTKPVISYIDKGVTRQFETTPEVAAAAKSLDKQQLDLVGRVLAAPTRVLRLGATGINPAFAMANVAKDTVSAFINSSHPLRSSVANPQVFVASLKAALNHGSKEYGELVREGAGGTSFDIARNAPLENIKTIRADKNAGTKALYTVTHPAQLFRAVENTIGRSEEFNRAMQYYGNKQSALKAGNDMGTAKILGAHAARNNTVNFARAGDYGRVANSVLPYLNAGVQGSRTLLRNLKERPAQTGSKLALTAFFPAAMVTAWNVGDPERKAAYDDIKDYEKHGNFIIVPPHPVKDKNGKWNVIKIPVSQEIANLSDMVRGGVEAGMHDGSIKLASMLGDVVGTATSVNAGSGRQLMNQITPQALKPGVESLTNSNLFTGNKIVPDSQKNLSPRDQIGANTSGTATILGKFSGLSPRHIDNAIRTATGGVGQNAVHYIDEGLAKTGVIQPSQVQGKGFGEAIASRFSGAQGLTAYDLADKQFGTLKKQLEQRPDFQAQPPQEKAKSLNRLQTQVTSANVPKISPSGVQTPLTKRQQDIAAGKPDLGSYLKAQTNTGSSIKVNPKIDQHSQKVLNEYNTLDAATKKQKAYKEPSYDYKVEKAKYDNDLANGKLSTTQKIKKQDSLAKAEVGSTFSKDTRELFGLGKDDLANYVENNPDGNAIAAKVIAYDQALTDKGVQAKNKFKNGVISYTASSAKGRAAASSRKATSDYLASLKSNNTAASQNQKALLNLVKGAKVTGAKRKLNVSSVALKKQKAKKQKVRVA